VLLKLNYTILCLSGWKSLTLSVVCLCVAMLCKEQGITIAGVCALYEVFIALKVKLIYTYFKNTIYYLDYKNSDLQLTSL